MKKYKEVLGLVILLTIIIIIILLFYKKSSIQEIVYIQDSNPKYVVFFNEYVNNGKIRKDWVYYYNDNFELIKKYNFNSKDKVPNQIKIKNKVYSYGYGGIYETDLQTMKTTPLNTSAPVNIIKYDNFENIYIYQNYGYENNLYDKYSSIILKNNEKFLELSYAIVDFCIYDEYAYITVYNDVTLKNGKILIYKEKNLIKEFDVNLENGEGNWAIYNNNIFFLNTTDAYRISDFELENISYDNNVTLVRPLVVNNLDFSKLFINSNEVIFKNNKLIFTNSKIENIENYDIATNSFLNCYFDKEKQLLFLEGTRKKISKNILKSKFIFLNAFEI